MTASRRLGSWQRSNARTGKGPANYSQASPSWSGVLIQSTGDAKNPAAGATGLLSIVSAGLEQAALDQAARRVISDGRIACGRTFRLSIDIAQCSAQYGRPGACCAPQKWKSASRGSPNGHRHSQAPMLAIVLIFLSILFIQALPTTTGY
jgi:hypothetical protein